MAFSAFSKADFREKLSRNAVFYFRKDLDKLSANQLYICVAYAMRDYIVEDWRKTEHAIRERDAKVVYYLSMEFLMGRALGNNLINMCAYEPVKEVLSDLGFDIDTIEDEEADAGLGNGGLGRLAACFLDSLATLRYPACGCGIRYHYGMFKQEIRDGYQVEAADVWLRDGYPFEIRAQEDCQVVRFGGYIRYDKDETGRERFVHEGYDLVKAVPFDIPIIGYDNSIVDCLRIWDARAMESFELSDFDKGDYLKSVERQNLARSISDVLYPNDNHYAGKELRLKQQYFFVSASVQYAVKRCADLHHGDVRHLYEKVAFQLNDTHPSVAVPELMRVLMDDYNLKWDEAWDITCKTCAYTNHTIMQEALEKWPIDLFQKLLPRIYQIVEEINRRFTLMLRDLYPGDNRKIESMAILYGGQVRMANLAIIGGHSVNGVAKLHTEILKSVVLKDFYELWPERFNNKTNGVTQRRFLCHGNRLQSAWITERIGDGWITDLCQLEKLVPYADDPEARKSFMDIKRQNKVRLCKYIKEHNGVDIDPDSIFDVQVKRLHEYKRQLLNILHVMYLYNRLKKDPKMDMVPRTFIFGAKASAGYWRAKMIIKLINSVADVINNDASIDGKIRVVFIENYRVSNAEIIFAASDVSEQISTASKEASGTGNMKFMLNGAITLGTMDGANVEIVEEVGKENAVIFGLSSEQVIDYEKNGGYDPRSVYNESPELREVLEQLINGTYSPNDIGMFRELYASLLDPTGYDRADRYFILADFASYAKAQEEIDRRYRDRDAWAKSAILNVAKSGKFSSDRTIEDYVRDIWGLRRL